MNTEEIVLESVDDDLSIFDLDEDNEEACYYVYVHTNKINGKKYVGMTKQNPKDRWRSNGIGYKNQVFYRAIEKYGWDNFEHEIIMDKLTYDEACFLEEKLIKEYKSLIGEHGYNITQGGDGSKGRKCSEEFKMSLMISRGKPIYQFDKDYNLLNEYCSCKDLERKTGFCRSNVTPCCKGVFEQANGFIWRYKEDIPNINDKEHIKSIFLNKKDRSVYAINIKTREYKLYDRPKDVSEDLGILSSSVTQCLCRAVNEYKGWQIVYKSEVDDIEMYIKDDHNFYSTTNSWRPIEKYSLDGKYICSYKSLRAAARSLGIKSTIGISANCNGERENYRGYIWKYMENGR